MDELAIRPYPTLRREKVVDRKLPHSVSHFCLICVSDVGYCPEVMSNSGVYTRLNLIQWENRKR